MIVSQDKIEKDWAARGYSCGLWVDPPGQLWEDYVHDTDELLMVMEGKLRLEISGVNHEALPGKEFFIPARAKHTVENTGGTTAKWLYGYKKK
ncbi:MAG: cupin domain-containing protein [Elusimicrobia bacterium RIFCSPLOWO2_01_FULL_54_10]|nr:MAG: cupin domain-containing protein [Elusimicrobia bacterium RIFCSPLOWO2_01_FULL_54_10]